MQSATRQPLSLPPHPPIWRTQIINLAIVAIIALLWPLGNLLEAQLDPYYFEILILIGINIVLATSLNLINGITGQFSLGHAGFMGIGAYTAGAVVTHYAQSHPIAGLSGAGIYVGAILLGGAFAAIAGLIIGIPTLRLSGDYLAIATLGFGEIIVVVIFNTQNIGSFQIGGASGLHGIPIISNFFWVFTAVLICVVCVWRLIHSAKGLALLAVREDEIAAAAMGMNTTYFKVTAFVIGAFFAGVAGGLSAMWFGNLDPASFGFLRSIEIVVMVVLGGSGSITGVILAAIVLTCLPEALRPLKHYTGLDLRLVIYSLLLIVMMLVRPAGLLGNRELWWTRKRPKPVGDVVSPNA